VRALPVILGVVGLVSHAGRLVAEDARLHEVRVAGNQRVEEEAIRVRLRTQPGSRLDEEMVDADVRSLYAMGFFDDVSAELVTEADRRVLTYRVVERPLIQSVRIEGEKKLGREELETALRVRPNTIFDPEKARRGIAEAKKLYEKKGYLDAAITYTLDRQPDNTATVRFEVDEGNRVRIRNLVFEGNRAFSARRLRGVMTTKTEWILSFLTGAGNLDREVLNSDIERLTAFYYDHGYIDVRIDEPLIERDAKGLEVTVKIDEGEVYQFGSVELGGDVLPAVEARSDKLSAKPGETFRPSLIREDINALTDVYGDFAYAFVNVIPETVVDQAGKRVNVTYRISKGPEVYIDRIEISGNTKTRDKVVRRELELDEQGPFSGTRLRRSQERLRRLGFFEDVNITTRKADRDDRLDLVVDVKEASTGSFSAGAGISSGDSFLFNVRLSEINFLGRGQRVILNADFGPIQRNFSLSFTEPYFLDTQLTAGVDAFNWRTRFDQFIRGGTGGSIRTLYPFTALGWRSLWGAPLVDTRFGLEYRIERAEISDVDSDAPSLIRAEEGAQLTSSVIPRLLRDTRNHPFFPTGGSLQDLSFEVAGLGGDAYFINLLSRARWYVPMWKSPALGTFVLSTGWNFGYGLGYRDEKELPLFERYFPGGINSIRGFETRSLGPQVPVFAQSNAPGDCPLGPGLCAQEIRRDTIGGSQQLIFNNEIIVPLVESLGLRGDIFFDAGNAFLATRGIDFEEFRLSTGFGIRWLSPIGPLRIEIGFPLNARDGDQTQRIQFSFGGPP
jgi:outer membrane protein insertion porin family